jgi:hypothetical protein
MTNIKNSVLVINLTLTLTLCVMTPINAQTSIAVQESRLDSLNDLSYQIKVSKSKLELSKSKAELAKLKKECLESKGCEADNNNHLGAIGNHSHLGTISSVVKPISTLSEHNNTEAVINKTLKPIQTNLIKELNTLSISAIINQRVAFKDIEGSFQQGDVLGDSGIKIISITQSGVVLSTANNPNNLNKTITITMDWIND